MTPDEWNSWFDAIDGRASLDLASINGIADVLYSRASRKENALPVELMDRAYALTRRVWTCLEKDNASETPSDNDWLTLTINRAAGQIAQFWLSTFPYCEAGTVSNGRAFLHRSKGCVDVVTGKSTAAGLAEVIVASQFHYFFYLDAKFARTELLSLFDWSADELRAAQSWQGFLAWGRWQKAYLDEMLPFYADGLTS